MTVERQDLPLREFAYFDREKVEDFLSALVGGLPFESREARKDATPAVDAELDLKVARVKRKGRMADLSWEEIRRATPASIFHNLYRLLDERSAIRRLEAFEKTDWAPLQEGDLVEVRCGVELSAVETLFDLIKRLGRLLPLLAPQQAQDPQWHLILGYLEILGQEERDSYNVRLVPVGAPTPRHTFVASLDKSKMRVGVDGLPGEYTVFGRIQRKLKRDESFELFSLMPRGFSPSRTQIRELLSAFKTMPPQLGRPPAMEDLRVSYPAIVLTPVAVFR